MSLVFQPLQRLPLPAARAIGESYGALAWVLFPRLRRRTKAALRKARPGWEPAEVDRLGPAVFRWVGRSGSDFLHLGGREVGRLLAEARVEGRQHFEAARAATRGTVVVTGHLGSWELLAAWLARESPPFRVLYHPFREQRLERMVQSRRRRVGVLGIAADRSAVAALRALRRCEAVGLLIDRVPRGPAVACRFFGRECRTAPGAAWLAGRSGALVLPVAMWHDARGGYRIRFEEPLPGAPPQGWEETAWTVELTRRLTSILEEQIREAPEQWPWFHDRWKIRPGPLLGGPLP